MIAATVARCTCAIEAAATGGPNEANTSRNGFAQGQLDRALGFGCGNGAILFLQRLKIARELHAD